jgi:hypothetical protein
MLEKRVSNDDEVNLREETLVTQHPGYTSTEQVVQDVAAERRIRLFQFNRLLWSGMFLLEILLAFRFGLRMIAANPDSGFAMFLYGVTGIFVGPFNGLIETPVYAGVQLEVTTLVAMAVYMLVFLGVIYGVYLIMDRPGARTFTQTTREQTPGGEGNVRTTHTTISDSKYDL